MERLIHSLRVWEWCSFYERIQIVAANRWTREYLKCDVPLGWCPFAQWKHLRATRSCVWIQELCGDVSHLETERLIARHPCWVGTSHKIETLVISFAPFETVHNLAPGKTWVRVFETPRAISEFLQNWKAGYFAHVNRLEHLFLDLRDITPGPSPETAIAFGLDGPISALSQAVRERCPGVTKLIIWVRACPWFIFQWPVVSELRVVSERAINWLDLTRFCDDQPLLRGLEVDVSAITVVRHRIGCDISLAELEPLLRRRCPLLTQLTRGKR
jgi:hypothetical protein